MPFEEVADRVWVARHDWLDLNVGVVAGDDGLLLVDTTGSAVAARAMLAEVRALGAGDVVAVVNTHEHFDHTFGNAEVRAAHGPVPIHAHEEAAARTRSAGDRARATYAATPDDPRSAEVLATTVLAADQVLSSVRVLDLGGRTVELVHPGRGHTSGDVVVRVPDVDVVLTGDLVEESTTRHGPGFGDDCHPFEWPLALDLVLGLLTTTSVVVPGHGARVDREFVEEQRNAIGIVAETIRDLASRGVPVADALGAASWPYPAEDLVEAVRRGYAQLPRSQKRLPLV